MVSAAPQKIRRPRRRKPTKLIDRFLGIDLPSGGEPIALGRAYGDGEGFVHHLDGGVVAWKLPHLQAVFFLLSNGKTGAFLYQQSSGRWREASEHLVPRDGRAALPKFSISLWAREQLARRRETATWLPLGSEFPLSPSLKFHPDGTVEYTKVDGKRVSVQVASLPLTADEVALTGIGGKRVIRGMGETRYNLESPGTRFKERFRYDKRGRRHFRHAIARPFASGEKDQFGVIYLGGDEVVITHAPIPYRQQAGTTPWSVDLPDGERIEYRGERFLLIRDRNGKLHERFCDPSGQWLEFRCGMWQAVLPWVLNGENQLSTKVCDVLEVFKDGSVCFLNQWSFARGAAIDVKSPNGILHLVRNAGSDWLDLFEDGAHLGSGCYAEAAFAGRDNKMHPGFAWGQDLDLPVGCDSRSQFVLPWALLVGAALLWWCPLVTLGFVFIAILIFGLAAVVCQTAAATGEFFGPALSPLKEPLGALLLHVRTYASTLRKKGNP